MCPLNLLICFRENVRFKYLAILEDYYMYVTCQCKSTRPLNSQPEGELHTPYCVRKEGMRIQMEDAPSSSLNEKGKVQYIYSV